jgi:hypothetical protein
MTSSVSHEYQKLKDMSVSTSLIEPRSNPQTVFSQYGRVQGVRKMVSSSTYTSDSLGEEDLGKLIIINASASGFTLTLPNVVNCIGGFLKIYVTVQTNAVRIQSTEAGQIMYTESSNEQESATDHISLTLLTSQQSCLDCVCDGSYWYISVTTSQPTQSRNVLAVSTDYTLRTDDYGRLIELSRSTAGVTKLTLPLLSGSVGHYFDVIIIEGASGKDLQIYSAEANKIIYDVIEVDENNAITESHGAKSGVSSIWIDCTTSDARGNLSIYSSGSAWFISGKVVEALVVESAP